MTYLEGDGDDQKVFEGTPRHRHFFIGSFQPAEGFVEET